MLPRNLLNVLECPRCHRDLDIHNSALTCSRGHSYPVIDGIPVFILPEKHQTIGIALNSYQAAVSREGAPLYLDTLGISATEKSQVEQSFYESGNDCRAVISYLVGATCGLGYKNLIGHVSTYPIPRIPTGSGAGKLLLDIGCSWGRWSVSAARKGWKVVGIDPSLGAVLAARRAFADAENVMFVCGDARYLPFKPQIFQHVFSYSVLQHFSESNTEIVCAEIGRVLEAGAQSQIQMAHRGGLRARYIRAHSHCFEDGDFKVRYWSLGALKQTFSDRIGPSNLLPEAFGGLGLLAEDWKYVSTKARLLIFVSSLARMIATYLRPLILLADSVYVVSTKRVSSGT